MTTTVCHDLTSILYFCPMHQVNVNNKKFDVAPDQHGFSINGSPVLWDLKEIEPGYFHILLNNRSYRAEVVKADASTKTVTFKINGKILSAEVKDKFDLLLEKMGMNNAAAGKINSVKAPMPGLIIDLKVKVGENVKPGDPLLILEAMKMENIIKSTGEGTVKNVRIKKGDSVEKGQVLIEF